MATGAVELVSIMDLVEADLHTSAYVRYIFKTQAIERKAHTSVALDV